MAIQQLLADDPEIIELGRMAVVYIPVAKLEKNPSVQTAFDNTLIQRYRGITKITQYVEGHYQMGPTTNVIDNHIRYEISFAGGEESVVPFINILKQLCRDLGENSLYVTMGEKSFLVRPLQGGS
jgi:hypothetical protein